MAAQRLSVSALESTFPLLFIHDPASFILILAVQFAPCSTGAADVWRGAAYTHVRALLLGGCTEACSARHTGSLRGVHSAWRPTRLCGWKTR
mmetsp:Transcript_31897/g.75144  ORF Transcript_31897/g.75144 Transcript_31897/m.75144 type:complete len:92 (+) Transcript_31897:23-298(+)|eukprot:92421-Rhodomonas_salina.1